MDFLYQLEDRLMDELKQINAKEAQSGEMTAQCLDNIKDITSSLNHIATYTAMKNSGYSRGGNMGRYSNRGYSRNRMPDDEWEREKYGMY